MSCVTNNGFHTQFFNIKRGVRQGCPILALLFIFCVDVIPILKKEIKITQFADDTCLYLIGSNSLENVVKVFEDFYRYAGLKLNVDKTEVIWLGKNNRFGKICNINITSKPIKVLGIWLSKDADEVLNLNFEERIDKLNILLNAWKQRNLTIKGKIIILKSKALPLITYATNFLYVPNYVVDAIDKLIYSFVWKSKHHVKKSTLIEKPSKGGLKMPDTTSVIKANKLNFIKRMLNMESNSNITAGSILRTNDVENFLKHKNNTKFLHPMPQFYKQLIEMWYSVYNIEPLTKHEVLNELIWSNEKILMGNKPIHNKEWVEAGISRIGDLLKGSSFMTLEHLQDSYNVSCDQLFYNGLRSAIPQQWVDIIKAGDNLSSAPIEKHTLTVKLNNKNVELMKATCRQFYWSEVTKLTQRPTCYYKWESQYYYASFDWDEINVIPYKCTSETYLQSLQYKIIHRYFPCKHNLHIWNIEECDTCNYCNQVDTLGHYFAECVTVCTFWKYLKTWFSHAFKFCINFTPLDILLGIPNHSNSTAIDILNFVILYAKFYIYSCKRNAIPIDLYSFQVKLKTRMVVEEHRCSMFNKQEEFQNKRSLLSDTL